MDNTNINVKRTPLFQEHKKLGAMLTVFEGFEMPLQYSGTILEHNSVRSHAGIFDVSHMGGFMISGKDSVLLMELMLTNNFSKAKSGSAKYTFLLNENGGIVDDLICYRIKKEKFFCVPNASTKYRVLGLFSGAAAGLELEIEDMNDSWGGIALQGPNSAEILTAAGFHGYSEMKRMSVEKNPKDGIIIATTGYTGEYGYEIFARNDLLSCIWGSLIDAGALPCGLSSRDTLRLEKGLLLSGQDFDIDTNPLETHADWAVKFDHDFKGSEAIKNKVISKKFSGFLTEKIVRSQAIIMHNDAVVGKITSGGYSPTLKKPIAAGYVLKELSVEGTVLFISSRGRITKAEVTSFPFVK